MKKLILILMAFAVLVFVSNASAAASWTARDHHTRPVAHAAATIGVCDVYANKPSFIGTTGYFNGRTDNCGTLGTGARNNIQVCSQNANGGWHDSYCSPWESANSVGQTIRWGQYTGCGWWRTVTHAGDLWEGVWHWGTVYSNANYRC